MDGSVGPNAVTRLAQALGAGRADLVFDLAELPHRLEDPPHRMVPEGEVTRLHQALRHALGEEAAAAASREAGRLTARYLLEHRIPRAMQCLLAPLPAGLAARLLLRAIGRHAWTFAGSGEVRILPGWPLRIAVTGGPIARAAPSDRPVCDYYAATFETLFRALVHPRTGVTEIACQACGAPSCLFELRWPLPHDQPVEVPGRVA